MPHITRQLIRKRSEHNEGIISTLEEISLHQEELEAINEVLGSTCRKLKILYLQNNIIPRMENLHHLKDLEYLNLALNNIAKIEGLENCEFLRKLDLTVNFIDCDALEESVDHLVPRHNLQELYLMGNPAQAAWENFSLFVIAKLPQLKSLDGTEITRSMQIRARQQLPKLEEELRALAEQVRLKKQQKALEELSLSNKSTTTEAKKDGQNEGGEENELTENTPEVRVKIYQELAQQKKEKADRERANAPPERDYEKEHAESVQSVRAKESATEETEIKQKNEGGWDFYWDEDSKPGCLILEIKIAKYLDSSLIDVDVHPTYVSVVIKGKVLRLRLPTEVKVAESKCQRSKTTGSLNIIMPKINPRESVTVSAEKPSASNRSTSTSNKSTKSSSSIKKPAQLSIHEQMMQEAMRAKTNLDAEIGSSSSVNIANIVKHKPDEPISTVFDVTSSLPVSQILRNPNI